MLASTRRHLAYQGYFYPILEKTIAAGHANGVLTRRNSHIIVCFLAVFYEPSRIGIVL